MIVPSTLTACAHALQEIDELVLFRMSQCYSLHVAINVGQLRCDQVCHHLACVFLPLDFHHSAQWSSLGAVLGMPFAFLCAGWKMHVLRFLVVKAGLVWKKWRHLAQHIAFYEWTSEALRELVVKAGAAW